MIEKAIIVAIWQEVWTICETNGTASLAIIVVFDTVNHDITLQNVKLYGFNYKIMDWLKSHLFNRYLVCVIGTASSTTSSPGLFP